MLKASYWLADFKYYGITHQGLIKIILIYKTKPKAMVLTSMLFSEREKHSGQKIMKRWYGYKVLLWRYFHVLRESLSAFLLFPFPSFFDLCSKQSCSYFIFVLSFLSKVVCVGLLPNLLFFLWLHSTSQELRLDRKQNWTITSLVKAREC